MEEIIFSSATTLARAIRSQQVSSQEVVDAHLQRIAAINPTLNAVVQLRAEAARAEAREADEALARGESHGPLHGVPFTVKDIYEVAGMICTCGTTGRAAYVASQDATAVSRMRAAGAIVLGLTNLPELGLAYESDNLVYGRTNNPYDLLRTPGGSSGGEAATIAAGGSPLGLGTDTGGSIRVPAHYCGVAGLKPTWGRVPLTGLFPPPLGLGTRLRHAGPLARCVEDLALTWPILSGMDWRDATVVPMPFFEQQRHNLKALRVAFFTDNDLAVPTPETVQTVHQAAQALAAAGAAVKEARPAGVEQSFDLMCRVLGASQGGGMQSLLQMIGTTEPSPLLQQISVVLRPYIPTSAAEVGSVVTRWDGWRNRMLSFLERYDVLLSPVTATPAVPHGTTFATENLPSFSYAMTHSLTGWPVVVVRGGTSSEDLPIGVQVAARPFREDVALAVAQQIETALGGWQRPRDTGWSKRKEESSRDHRAT
jgi:amidase